MKTLSKLEIEQLKSLRETFLSANPSADYWESFDVLELYAKTFGQRILWKCLPIFEECFQNSPFLKQTTHLMDWGCGPGIVSRAWLSRFQSEHQIKTLSLWDRSQKAMAYASQKTSEQFPEIEIRHNPELSESDSTGLIISHVAGELGDQDFASLLRLAQKSAWFLWVDAGTPAASHTLSLCRDRLQTSMDIVAPCPHSLPCPALGSSKDWCHFFSLPPSEVSQSPFWAHFSTQLKIDMRSLPVSFLLMVRKSLPGATALPPSFEGKPTRLIGRPRKLKARYESEACLSCGKLGNVSIGKKQHPRTYQNIKKKAWQPLEDGLAKAN